MTYLPSLLKRVDNFLRLTERFYPLKKNAAEPEDEEFDEPAPDYSQYDDPRFQKVTKDEPAEEEGPGLYPNIKRRIDLIEKRNEDVSDSLNLVALLYKKSLEINSGFAQVLAKISTAMRDIDLSLDDVESNDDIREESDSILEDMASDLRQRAKEAGPTQQANSQQTAKTLLDVSKEFNAQQAAGIMGSQKQVFEKGKPGAELGHLTGPPLSTETPEKYKKEIDSLQYILQNDQSGRDPAIRSQTETLIQVLKDLAVELIRVKDLQAELKVTPNDPEKMAVVESAVKNLDSLRSERRRLKRLLNVDIKEQQIKEFRAMANRPNIKPAEKLWWEQKAQLEEVRKSTDLRKIEEIKARERLINSTGVLDVHNDFQSQNITPEKLQELIGQVRAGKDQRVTRSDYDRDITLERGKQQARLVTPEYEPARGGGRVPMERLSPEKQINLEKASFSALVYQFQIDIASATQAARQAIYRAESKGAAGKENPVYKAIVDEISEAIRKKDREALYTAKNKLIEAVQGDLFVQKQQLKGYVDVLKLEPHFRKVLDSIKAATKSEKPSKKNPAPPQKLDEAGNIVVENFSEQDKESLKEILNDINRLRVLYTKYYTDMVGMTTRRENKPSTDWWEIKRLVTPRFKKVIEDMGRVETYLTLKLHVHRPEEKQLYPEKSPLLKEIGDKQMEQLKLEKQLKNSSISSRMQLLSFAISRKDYDRKLTEERGKHQARINVPSYDAARGGGRISIENLSPEEQIDFDRVSFAALIKKLRDDNNTAVSDARKYIMRPNEKGDPDFKPFVDNISATIRKKDKTAQYAAIEQLKGQINNKIKDSSLKGYIQTIRLAPHFKNIEERLYSLAKGEKGGPDKIDASGNLINVTEEDRQKLPLLLNDIRRLKELYTKYYLEEGGLKNKSQPYAFFKGAISSLRRLEMYLITNLNAKRPEKKILGPKTEYKQLGGETE